MTRRTVRRVGHVVEAVVVVVASRVVLGVWPTSIGLAAVGLWWGLRAWHRIETRSRHPHPPPVAAAPNPVRHVAFARALVAVADAYLSECEAEASHHDHH